MHELHQSAETQLTIAEHVNNRFEQAVMNPGFADLASLFSEEELSNDPRERLAQLRRIGTENWDFRKGAERQAVQWGDGVFANPQSEVGKAVFAGATKLGMVEPTPLAEGDYDMVVLGGANRSPLERLEWGLEQPARVHTIFMLGSTRKLSDAEKNATADFAPGAETEYDLMRAAVSSTFQESGREFTLTRAAYAYSSGEVAKVDRYATDVGNVYVLCAPAPDKAATGRDRANTSDTYRLLRTFAGNYLRTSDRKLALSTNAFFSGFQEADVLAEITLPTGAEVTCTSFAAAYTGKTRLPSQLLQEALSYVNSLTKLDEAIRAQVEQSNLGSVIAGLESRRQG